MSLATQRVAFVSRREKIGALKQKDVIRHTKPGLGENWKKSNNKKKEGEK